MSDEEIPAQQAIKEYIDKVEEMKLDPQKFFEEYLQSFKVKEMMSEIERRVEFSKVRRVTDVQEPRISPMSDFTTSATNTDYSRYRSYDDYMDDKRFQEKYCSSDIYYKKYMNPCAEIKLRGYMGPSPKTKKEEKPKQTVFQFDPTGMNDEWKKPKD